MKAWNYNSCCYALQLFVVVFHSGWAELLSYIIIATFFGFRLLSFVWMFTLHVVCLISNFLWTLLSYHCFLYSAAMGYMFLTIKRSHYTLPGITTSYNLRLLCKPPSFWQFKMQQVKFKHLCSFALLFLHRMWYILFILRDLNNFYPISVSWENHGL